MSDSQDPPQEESASSILEKDIKRQKDAIALLKEVMEFADPKTRKNLLNKLGARIKSTETYYSAKAASGIKRIVDEMMIDGKDREIRYSDFPQYSKSTIRAKINSAVKYIVDNLDDEDQKYSNWREQVRVCRTNTGMLFRYIRKSNQSPDIEFTAHVLENNSEIIELPDDDNSEDIITESRPKDPETNWKNELIEFVQEDKAASQFKRMNLKLTEEDKIFIKNLCQVPPYVIRVNSERITICNDPTNALNVPENERVIIK